MSVKDTIAAMRGEPRAAGIKLGMSKLNDALAKALYGRPYSSCVAAEAAGKPPQPSWDQARCAQVELSYGIHAGSLTAVVLATVTRLRVVQILIEDPPELPLSSDPLVPEESHGGAPTHEGATLMVIDQADEGRAQELMKAVDELPLPTIQDVGTDPKPHLLNALVAHANREGVFLDGMADESTFDGLIERLYNALKKEVQSSGSGANAETKTAARSFLTPERDQLAGPSWRRGGRAVYYEALAAYRETIEAIAENREKGTPLTRAQQEFVRIIAGHIKGVNVNRDALQPNGSESRREEVQAESYPSCGACPGDGSICKTTCKLDEESPRMIPNPDVIEALRRIVTLDEEREYGLLTWREFRAAAHKDAVKLIAERRMRDLPLTREERALSRIVELDAQQKKDPETWQQLRQKAHEEAAALLGIETKSKEPM